MSMGNPDTAMSDEPFATGADDFLEGLGIDYSFLEGSMDMPSASTSACALPAHTSPSNTLQGNLASMELSDSTTTLQATSSTPHLLPVREHEPSPASSPAFPVSLDGSTTPPPLSAASSSYHRSPTHKHKRVRSNPDALLSFNYQTMDQSTPPGSVSGPASPVLTTASAARGAMPALAEPTAPHGVSSGTNGTALPPPLPIAIGPVEVTTPMALKQEEQQQVPLTLPEPIQFKVTPKQMSHGSSMPSTAPFDDDIDDYLRQVPWNELPDASRDQMDQLSNIGAIGSSHVKRKREGHHQRHRSNPDGLQQLYPPPSMLNPMAMGVAPMDGSANGMFMPPGPMGMNNAAPNSANMMMMPTMNVNPFAMPTSMPDARPSHDRRASMPANMLASIATAAQNSSPVVPSGTGPRPGHRGRHSTGLSVDLSHMNLGSMLRSPTRPDTNSPSGRRRSTGRKGSTDFGNEAGTSASNRKMYKCGRCGQPKVGHTCTMPDQRNNWSQVDLEITTGKKMLRVNCHLVAVKNQWIPQHEDNL